MMRTSKAMLHLADPRVSASKRFARRANPCERGNSLSPRMAARGAELRWMPDYTTFSTLDTRYDEDE